MDADTRVKKMKVKYFDDEDSGFFVPILLGTDAEPVYEKQSTSASVRDGRKTFGKDRDNLTYITVQVKWGEVGPQGDNERLTCFIPVDDNFYS